MSDEKEEKNETEVKLMADQNETEKSYGTDDRVILAISDQNNSDQDQEAGAVKGNTRHNRNRSVLQKMRSYETTDSHIGFLEKVVSFIFNTIVGIIALLLANIISVACIVIGSVYMKDCPSAPGIPVILIVNGAINVLICFLESIKKRINPNSDILKTYNLQLTLLKIASTISFLCWAVIVYDTEYPTFGDPTDKHYCDKTVFLFAYWLLNCYLILLALIMFFVCCCCCCMGAGAVKSAIVEDKDKADDQG